MFKAVLLQKWRGQPYLRGCTPAGRCSPKAPRRRGVRFRDPQHWPGPTAMAKVFGCREAYENRPSTNPRACGAGLWGFRALALLWQIKSLLTKLDRGFAL